MFLILGRADDSSKNTEVAEVKHLLLFLTALSCMVLAACTASPTPELEATVQAAVAATQAAQPTNTLTPEPTDTLTPEPSDTPTPEPTDTPVPTRTARPTETPMPTDTPEPTATQKPTDTPTLTAAPTPSYTVTPEPTPALIDIDVFHFFRQLSGPEEEVAQQVEIQIEAYIAANNESLQGVEWGRAIGMDGKIRFWGEIQENGGFYYLIWNPETQVIEKIGNGNEAVIWDIDPWNGEFDSIGDALILLPGVPTTDQTQPPAPEAPASPEVLTDLPKLLSVEWNKNSTDIVTYTLRNTPGHYSGYLPSFTHPESLDIHTALLAVRVESLQQSGERGETIELVVNAGDTTDRNRQLIAGGRFTVRVDKENVVIWTMPELPSEGKGVRPWPVAPGEANQGKVIMANEIIQQLNGRILIIEAGYTFQDLQALESAHSEGRHVTIEVERIMLVGADNPQVEW